MSRLLTQVAPLALLLLFAASAQAATYYVDLDGGSDTAFDGSSATVTGVGNAGPFMTINRALTAAGNNDTIVILASVYTESFTVTESNLTITALPEGGDRTVRLTGDITLAGSTASSVQFTAGSGAGTTGVFVVNSPNIRLTNGSINVGTGITTIGDGAEVTITRTSGTFTGTPVFASTPNVIYNGNASITSTSELPATVAGTAVNPDPTITVAFTGTTPAAPKTLTLAGPVALGSGAIVNVAANNIISGALSVTGNAQFNGPGRFGDVSVVSGGALAVNTNISAKSLTLSGTGTVNAGPNTITLFGNFTQNGGLTTFQAGSLAFDGAGSYTFTPLGGFNATNLAIGVGADTNPTVTFGGDATIAGAFTVAPTATAALAGNLVNISAGGTSDVDGTVTNGGVAFQGSGSTIDGTGVYDQILVLGPGGNVTTVAGADFTFTGQLLLSGGALNNAAATDISPSGPNASVFVVITNAPGNNNGLNKINGGKFNLDNAPFNLSYQGTNANYTVGSEFDTEEIRNLVVNATGLVDASAVTRTGPTGGTDSIDGTVTLTALAPSATTATTDLEVRFPTYSVDVVGALTVGDDVLLTVAPVQGPVGTPTPFTGDLTLLSATNSVIGTLDGPGRLVLGSGAAGSTPGITGVGATATASAASALSPGAGILVASNAAATISGVELIGTQIRDGNASSTLSLGLAREIPATAAPAGAGNVTGTVLLNGGLTLTSDVQFNGALTLNGAVAIGTNDVVFNDALLTLKGQTVTGTTGEFQFIAASTFDPQEATVPGVNVIAPTTLVSRVTAVNTFRLASIFDANTASDNNTSGPSIGDDFLTLAANGTIILADNGVVVGDNVNPPREVVLAGAFNFTNQQTSVFSPFAVTLFGSPQLLTFTSDAGAGNYQALPEVSGALTQQTFTVQNFVQASGRFNLAGHNVEVTGNTTLLGTTPIVNLQGGIATSASTDTDLVNFANTVSRTDGLNPYSEFRFTGGTDGTLTLASLGGAAGAYIGSGVDLVLNKASQTSTVTLAGEGALLFDDQFTPSGVPAAFVQDTPNDETFVLKQGVFAMANATPADRAKFYVNLDHENTTTGRTAEATSDNGQGFVFRAPSTQTVPVAQIAGTIQKRIFSNPNVLGSGSQPGRVVNPLGDRAGEYAEFVFDFESIQRDQDFGRRDLRTTFLATSPGGSLGLPIQDAISPGVAVGATGNFTWLVTSNPTLGANTEFNVEARYDGYTLGTNEAIQDLRLVRRQFGDETQNPFTLVSTSYDNFLIDPTPGDLTNRDEEPTVVAQNAQALLGPQGTLFTFGLRGVAPTNVASFQVVNNSVTGGPVDVYVGSTLIADNLAYGKATSYKTVTGVTGTSSVTVTIAPENSTSPSSTGSRAITTSAVQGKTYAVVVFDDGMDATTGDKYDAVVVNTMQTASQTSDTVELIALNGSKDAGRIDIGLKGATSAFFKDLQFGEQSLNALTGIDATLLRFDVSPQGTTTPFYTGNLDLSSARGERGLLIAQGLRAVQPGQPTRGFRLIFVRPDGSIITSGNSVATGGTVEIPAEFALRGTAPNPFRTTTSVRFDLPEAAEVQVEVYDALGRRVMQTAPSTMAPGADHGIEVNGTGLAAGLYVYRLTARGESQSWSQTGQITVLR